MAEFPPLQSLRPTEARETYTSLVDSLPLCVLVKDLEGRRVFANAAYLQWRKVELHEIVGKVDHDLFPKQIAEKYIVDDLQVLREKTPLHNIELTRDGLGRESWIERVKISSLTPMELSLTAGHVLGCHAIACRRKIICSMNVIY